VAHGVDIDERKRMEEMLRVSQKENKFLADLIRNSSQPLGVGYALETKVRVLGSGTDTP